MDAELSLRDVLFFKPNYDEVSISFRWPECNEINAVFLLEVVNGLDNPEPIEIRERRVGDRVVYLGPVKIDFNPKKYKLLPVTIENDGNAKAYYENSNLSETEYLNKIHINYTVNYTKLTRRNRFAFTKKYYNAHVNLSSAPNSSDLLCYVVNDLKYPFDTGLKDYIILTEKENSVSIIPGERFKDNLWLKEGL